MTSYLFSEEHKPYTACDIPIVPIVDEALRDLRFKTW